MKREVSQRPFFSIIVPCCNVARYFDEMAASVKAQSFADWECILSYEDSTDGTQAACEALVKSDPRFSLVKGPRSGSASAARNRGLDVARGRYAFWLDGDDFLAEGSLALIAQSVAGQQEPCDLVLGAGWEFLEDAEGRRTDVGHRFNFPPDVDGCVFSGPETLVQLSKVDYIWPMPALYVCRVDYLREKGLRFLDGRNGEDDEWVPRIVALARRVLVLEKDFYFYRHRAGSVTTTVKELDRWRQYAEVVRSHIFFFTSQTFPDEVLVAAAHYYLSRFFEAYWLRTEAKISPFALAFARTRCLRRILEKGGRAALWKLSARASLPKRVGVALLMVAGIHPILDLPANVYFGLYYQIIIWRVRRRGNGDRS